MKEDEKINILYLVDNLRSGGAQKDILSLSEMLPADKYRVHTISLGKKGPFYERFKEKNQIIYSFDISRLWHLIRLRELGSYIRKNNIKIVHCFLSNSRFFGSIIGKLCNVPLIVYTECAPLSAKKKYQKILEKLTDFLIDGCIAISDSVKTDMIKEGQKPEKITRIYNGVDDRIGPSVDPAKMKRQLGISESGIVIGSVGRLAEEKGHIYLIKAFKSVAREYKNSFLVLVGNGPLLNYFKKESAESGLSRRIIFTGYTKDVVSYLNIMDIFVLPSAFEGLGDALLEAMSQGLPSVASSVNGITEVVKEGETGYLVPPQNEDALEKAITKIIDNKDLMKKMGKAAKKRVKCFFSVEEMVDNYDKFYTQMMLNKGFPF